MIFNLEFTGWHVANEIAKPKICINSQNSSIDCKKTAIGNGNLQPEIEINDTRVVKNTRVVYYSSSTRVLEYSRQPYWLYAVYKSEVTDSLSGSQRREILRRVRMTDELEYEVRDDVADHRDHEHHETVSVDRQMVQLPAFHYQLAVNPRVVLRAVQRKYRAVRVTSVTTINRKSYNIVAAAD